MEHKGLKTSPWKFRVSLCTENAPKAHNLNEILQLTPLWLSEGTAEGGGSGGATGAGPGAPPEVAPVPAPFVDDA